MYNYKFQTKEAQEHQPAELVGGLDLTPGRGEFTQHNQAWGKEWEDPLK